ncbi:hypothetical protein U1Q18_049306, partial [Sarracenia purpurea var. burkii]
VVVGSGEVSKTKPEEPSVKGKVVCSTVGLVGHLNAMKGVVMNNEIMEGEGVEQRGGKGFLPSDAQKRWGEMPKQDIPTSIPRSWAQVTANRPIVGDSEGSKAVEVKYEEARSASIVSDKEGISQIFGEVSENQLEQCPKGDFRSVARVPVVLNSGFVASIEDEEDADGDGVVAGVLKESDESRPGDPVDEEDETDPKPKGGDVSVSEVVTGEGVNNKVISVSPVFLIRDGVGDAAFEDFVDSGVKVKQVREKSEDSCSARHVFENLPESPLEANLESGKPKALSPFFQGC